MIVTINNRQVSSYAHIIYSKNKTWSKFFLIFLLYNKKGARIRAPFHAIVRALKTYFIKTSFFTLTKSFACIR